MARIFSLLLAGLLLPLYAAAQPKQAFDPSEFDPSEAAYLWPTNASRHLTSTFGETRSAHFHAALDIKTWGRRGYEVYATRDGVLHRIAIKPTGYGKVIYLKHEDGSFSIYAHLMSFNKKLQQFADSIRFAQDYNPSFDRVVEEHNIRVKQGDLIAYSGASGIGPPHLHFELRQPDHRPFNPLLTNLSVEDTIVPRITGLSVEPLSPHSSVEGSKQVHIRKPGRQNGQYRFGTVEVSGPVGLGLDVYDQSNGVSNAYGVYELSMSVNGRERFYSKMDRFSYDETRQMLIDRVYPLLKDRGRAFQRLFVTDGNTLPFYQTDRQKGRLHLPAGTHEVIIRATDYFGNQSTAVLNLRVTESSVQQFTGHPPRLAPSKIPEIDIDNWHWFNNWVVIPQKYFQELIIANPDPWRLTTHRDHITVDLHTLDNFFMNIPGMSAAIFHRMQPGKKGLLSSVNQRTMAVFPQHTFYDTVSVTLSSRRFAPDSIKITVGPDSYPLNKAYQLFTERDLSLTDTTNLSFYKYNKRYNSWSLIPTRFTDKHMIGKTRSLGTFISRRDTIPPKLERARLHRRPDGQWLVYVDAEDRLSGIDESRTIMILNGRRGLAEYEPEDRRIVYYHPDFTPSGDMDIQVSVFDRMGNRTDETFHLAHEPR